MVRRHLLRTTLAALAMVGAAQADEGLYVPLGTAEVTLKSAPRAVLSFLKAVGRTSGMAEAACPVGACAPGDQACRQNVFHAVLGCLREGRVAALPDCADCALPPGDVTLFRAHGDGLTLYGTVGRGTDPRLLRALSRAVEAPPLLNMAPPEGGTP